MNQATSASTGLNLPLDAPLIELRQYTLHDGTRETLIELFDRVFVESQEDLGMQVIAQFRDLDRANRFVWLRGFAHHAARAPALASFYGGPVWKAHRDAANATMIDFDDVHLLTPAWPGSAIATLGKHRPPPQTLQTPLHGDEAPSTLIVTLALPSAETMLQTAMHVQTHLQPLLRQQGVRLLGAYRTAQVSNDFPALPVHEGQHVVVVVLGLNHAHGQAPAHDQARVLARFDWALVWAQSQPAAALAPLSKKAHVLRLLGTARSLI